MDKETKGNCMIYLISLALLVSSCTYSVNLIHTKGSATDVVDETQDASPNVSPTVSVMPA
jgi:hypothetical protein